MFVFLIYCMPSSTNNWQVKAVPLVKVKLIKLFAGPENFRKQISEQWGKSQQNGQNKQDFGTSVANKRYHHHPLATVCRNTTILF